MEFLSAKELFPEFRAAGVVEVPSDGLLRFDMRPSDKPAREVHHAAVGSKAALARLGVEGVTVDRASERLPGLVEDILHKHRVAEVFIVPVGQWRDVCDTLSMELASDESWLEIDADAALHLNTRDPLALSTRDFHILPLMLGALCRAAGDDSSGRHDMTILAPGVGIVLEFSPAGTLRMAAANAVFCEELVEMA